MPPSAHALFFWVLPDCPPPYFALGHSMGGGILLSACSGGTGGSGEKVIRAGSTGQSYPNGFREGDKLVGYDVELLETAAKDLGYTVQWTTAEFSGIMGQLEAGRLDTVANNVAVTAARKEKFDFTATYAYLGAQVVTKADNTSIKAAASPSITCPIAIYP